MAVPGFQELMLPLLRLGSDGQSFTQMEAVVALADATYTLAEINEEYFDQDVSTAEKSVS